MFCPGDQPLLSGKTLESLLLSAVSSPESIWRTCCDVTLGSPVLFPKWTFPELLSLPQGKGGGAVIKQYPQKCEMLPVSDPWELVDADTPEILAQLRQHAFNQTGKME
jgi:molybdenum cofactor cytidylyltransferase